MKKLSSPPLHEHANSPVKLDNEASPLTPELFPMSQSTKLEVPIKGPQVMTRSQD